ncbi:AfsR/SARP family transcriptional regulator [Amycolatopsis jiangsuensis]|uniref:DNA-binding SARP family transcriptional activator n=1 Tax=Amycolatopsis jiangsuensis TaxID=1181879 RepID=A0A840J781_9PSEU|nr:BTAD domain-containing putative transcriptional regulator [Amycolatopsis jiangsuensis]MBB4689643.1 DNA-binding SARP family transcriptional activator [Amycolatopsis jiangsuensis]
MLAARANAAVPLPEIVAALWGQDPPKSAEGAVYTYISSLRKALEPDGGSQQRPGPLVRTRAGYTLVLPGRTLDVAEFEETLRSARRRRDTGDGLGALREAEAALALWQGPALGGASGPFAETERTRLDLARLDAEELRAEALVATGAAEEVVGRLSVLAAEHPLRERLHELLVLALGRSGRRGEALEAYRHARQTLVTELGIEPGPVLQELHRDVLADDDPGPSGRPSAVPAQLPREVPGFSGRRHELEYLLYAVGEGGATLVTIDGIGGAGKTALAIRLARRLAQSFPDGQLFVDLQGYAAGRRGVGVEDALARLVTGLGGPADFGGDAEAGSGLFRTMAAGKRLLVVLDNAVDAAQVRALLPGDPRCLVIVTSRDRMPGLVARDGATRVHLGPLPAADAVALLRWLPGTDDRAATELAALCGNLPLALRVVAERIRDFAEQGLDALVAELRDERRRLDALAVPDDEVSDVRAVFSWSYAALEPAAAAAFRALGVHPGGEIDPGAAAATVGADADRLLGVLERRHLLGRAANDSYRCHDLMRIYAAERVGRSTAEADAARARMFAWYLDAARTVRTVLTPGLGDDCAEPPVADGLPAISDHQDGVAWATRRMGCLEAMLRLAVEHGHDAIATRLATAFGSLYYCTSRWSEWLETVRLGREAAERRADSSALGRLRNDAGVAWHFLGKPEKAAAEHRAAIEILSGQDGAVNPAVPANLAVAYSMLGRQLDAVPLLRDAWQAAQDQGNPHLEAVVAINLCAVLSGLGNHDDAIDCGRRGVRLAEATGAGHLLGHALTELGQACSTAGRPGDAREWLVQAFGHWHALGDEWGRRAAADALAGLPHGFGLP